MLWALLNTVQCVLIRSRVLGALVLGRVIAGQEVWHFFNMIERRMLVHHASYWCKSLNPGTLLQISGGTNSEKDRIITG